jgi:ribosomal protein L30
MTKSVIMIRQTRSPIRRHHDQRETLVGLNLNRIGRVVQLLDTPETRGMIRKVKHLVEIVEPAPGDVKPITKLRFNALAAYTRSPYTIVLFDELEWYATADERVVGVVLHDRTDSDFGCVVLGRDERRRFRAIDVNGSFETAEVARKELFTLMKDQHARPDEKFHQGDATGPAMDFLTPMVPESQLNATFKILTTERRWSPASGLIKAMMRYYEDADGNFVQQFQTTAFDARIWELYLYAAFTELGYASTSDNSVPDFVFASSMGAFGVEATSANPPQRDDPKALPKNKADLSSYIENYIPIKLARRLKDKLVRNPPYWQEPGMEGLPFVISVQDFHSPGSMRMITSAMTEYVFGVRHTLRRDGIHIERIGEHVWGNIRENSGFFYFDNAENVSAVIINPQGTLPKFSRIGYLAEFGDRRVRMIRSGIRRGELDASHPMPRHFRHIVHATGYSETWVEGMVVLHNPRALRPLDPELIPGAAHEFLQQDGRIMSLLPPFHPVFSGTSITAPK